MSNRRSIRPADATAGRDEHVEMVRPAEPEVVKQPDKSLTVGRGIVSNFSQQKLRAWQPVLTPKWIISVFLGFGVIFVALGELSVSKKEKQEYLFKYSERLISSKSTWTPLPLWL